MTYRARAITALIVGTLMTLLILGWPIAAHYVAKGRLERYQARLKADGEKITVGELVPNLSAADISAANALDQTAAQLPPLSSNSPSLMKLTSPGRALVAWEQETLANGDVSNVWDALSTPLEANADKLAEIRALLQNYSPAFNLNYDLGFNLLLPHLPRLKGAAQWLSAATVFELHQGRATNALENLAALTELAGKTDREALMISELVRIAISAIGMATSWEALQSPELSEESLRGLQKSWESVDFLTQAESTLAMERAMGEKTFLAGRLSYSVIANGGFSSGTPRSALAELTQMGKDMLDNPKEGLQSLAHRYPGYWRWKLWQSYDDELASDEVLQASLEAVRAARKDHVFGPALKELEKKAAAIHTRHPSAGHWLGYWFANDEVMTKFVSRIARIEMERALLVTAVALQRYHLEHHTYPEHLAALSPQFIQTLVQDPMDGQLLRYRLRADGSFILYSVGDDGQDNGGDATPEGAFPKQWLRAKDAVWPVPATQVEAKAEVLKLAAEWKKKDLEAAGSMEFRKRYGLVSGPPQPSGVTNQTVK